jgi:uncharacterized protein YbjT (DUF2867 family)
MSKRNKILVIGATGAQGGSVARHLLRQGTFAVRGLTRNPASAAAGALQQAGAEMVQGDLDDMDSLRAALDGCYGVFGVTNFWEHFDHEYQQGKNLIDTVAASKIQHFVFSTLPSYSKLSGGALTVPHCDIKAQLEDYARSLDLPSTFIHVAFYYENFLSYFPPQRQEDGRYTFGFPQGETPLASVSVEDVGGVVAPLFEQREEVVGKTIGIVGDDQSPSCYAETMSRVFGRQVAYTHIPRDVFASFGFPGAEELANMFDFQRRYIPNRHADLVQSRVLYPDMQTLEQWLWSNRERFPAFVQR